MGQRRNEFDNSRDGVKRRQTYDHTRRFYEARRGIGEENKRE